MQDVGNKEDTELSREDLTLSWRELPVESLGHCQSVGNWMFSPTRAREERGTQVYTFPWRNTLRALGHLAVRRGIETFGGTGKSLRKPCPKKLCQPRGSSHNLGTTEEKHCRIPCKTMISDIGKSWTN